MKKHQGLVSSHLSWLPCHFLCSVGENSSANINNNKVVFPTVMNPNFLKNKEGQ